MTLSKHYISMPRALTVTVKGTGRSELSEVPGDTIPCFYMCGLCGMSLFFLCLQQIMHTFQFTCQLWCFWVDGVKGQEKASLTVLFIFGRGESQRHAILHCCTKLVFMCRYSAKKLPFILNQTFTIWWVGTCLFVTLCGQLLTISPEHRALWGPSVPYGGTNAQFPWVWRLVLGWGFSLGLRCELS